jgi:hypothetical protein
MDGNTGFQKFGEIPENLGAQRMVTGVTGDFSPGLVCLSAAGTASS